MPAIAIWVWFCAYLNCAGWALSVLHQLDAGGYAIALLVWFAAFFAWWKRTSTPLAPRLRRPKLRRCFRHPFPLAFLILAAMALLGGALYPPSNYDALAYREPRVLHWLAAGQWHWIHTIFPRINTRSCGIEWVSAPCLALLKTDRPLFLINAISFLFLPGLVFSVFTRLGVRRRVAWHWMWIVPTGYGLLLQAGSLGNDLFSATFALAAVDFAMRAKISGSFRDLSASILAAAMMTSAKMNNLPLLLPVAIALLPSLKMMLRRPFAAAAVCLMAVSGSALPTMILNDLHCGDWTGLSLELGGFKKDPVFQLGVNTALAAVENLVPPVFPQAGRWNSFMNRVIPPALQARLDRTILQPDARFHLDEMQIEENAGLGFGVSVLLLISIAAAPFAKRRPAKVCRWDRLQLWRACVCWSPFVSLVVLLTQSNMSGLSRLLLAYYALLLPPLLAGAGQERLVRQSWWRAAAFAVFVMAAGLLVVSPARPLFPVQTILAKMRHPSARVQTVYSIYRERSDAFAPVRAFLPPGLKVLGAVTVDDPETSLWRPFGSRRVIQVCPGDTAADLKRRGIEYVLVKPDGFESRFGCPPGEWFQRMNARVVQKIPLSLRAAAAGPLDWYLVKLQ